MRVPAKVLRTKRRIVSIDSHCRRGFIELRIHSRKSILGRAPLPNHRGDAYTLLTASQAHQLGRELTKRAFYLAKKTR